MKFLSILGSNVDEFGTIRFPELKRAASAVLHLEELGESVTLHHTAIERAVTELMHDARQYLANTLIPELAKAGIHIMSYRT